MFENEAREPIAQPVVVNILDDSGQSTPVSARFDYDPAAPYAMSIVFYVDPAPLRWTFARELFLSGFYTPTGEGDVTVFPCLDANGRSTVVISLSSPSGEALIEVNAKTASRLIWRMVRLVPWGAEGSALDVDGFIADLLREVPDASCSPAQPRQR